MGGGEVGTPCSKRESGTINAGVWAHFHDSTSVSALNHPSTRISHFAPCFVTMAASRAADRPTKTSGQSKSVHDYIVSVATKETPQHVAIRELTQAMPEYMMQISPDQGAFMHALIKATGGKVRNHAHSTTPTLLHSPAVPADWH